MAEVLPDLLPRIPIAKHINMTSRGKGGAKRHRKVLRDNIQIHSFNNEKISTMNKYMESINRNTFL